MGVEFTDLSPWTIFHSSSPATFHRRTSAVRSRVISTRLTEHSFRTFFAFAYLTLFTYDQVCTIFILFTSPYAVFGLIEKYITNYLNRDELYVNSLTYKFFVTRWSTVTK